MATGLALAVYGLLLVPGAVLVWRRPVLALYAWIIGLAAHNAVMAALYGAGVRGSALTAIQAWKEILLAVALGRVAFDAVRARRLAFRFGVVDVLALAFAVIVCIYALLPQSWFDVAAAGAVAVVGLLDDFLIPVSWWRSSAVVDYFHKQLGYDYKGTGGLPENFIYNTGSEDHFLRRLVSVFLGPLASAYLFVVALLLATRVRQRWAAAVAAQPLGQPARRRAHRRPPSAGLRAGQRGADRAAHRHADQGRRVELHGARRRNGPARLAALGGVGDHAARRAH